RWLSSTALHARSPVTEAGVLVADQAPGPAVRHLRTFPTKTGQELRRRHEVAARLVHISWQPTGNSNQICATDTRVQHLRSHCWRSSEFCESRAAPRQGPESVSTTQVQMLRQSTHMDYVLVWNYSEDEALPRVLKAAVRLELLSALVRMHNE